MAPNLVLALLLNLVSDVLFVVVSLKSCAVFRPVARRKGISLETCVDYMVIE